MVNTKTTTTTWPDIVTPPWDHQVEAYERALYVLRRSGGFGLFLDMGTGKSNVVLALIAALKPRRTLILCPKSMLDEWPQKFEDHYHGKIDVVRLDGTIAQRAAMIRTETDPYTPTVYVTNYESVDKAVFTNEVERAGVEMIVADESHKAKSPSGVRSKALRRLGRSALYRLALTGTPIHHTPLDVWAQYAFLNATIFEPTYTRFKSRYAVTYHNGKYEQILDFINLDELHEKMYQIAYRVDKSVLTLPDLMPVIDHPIKLAPETRRIYTELYQNLVVELRDGTLSAANTMVRMLRLQQLTGGTVPVEAYVGGRTYETQQVVGTEKADALFDILDGTMNEPVVVFARFRSDLDAIKKVCAKAHRPFFELSGRKNDLEGWKDHPFGPVLAVQIQAGSAGIDLTKSSRMIFYSTGFSLGDYQQAIARLHRPGQTAPVTIHHLTCVNTVDEYVRRAIEKKADIAAFVTDILRESP